jgi:cellulose synthase/poly-beta-1,6-N-acetylglucosamine synthase-like glycosyltransferase
MSDLKDVSFVMPVLNEQDYLAIAVESVLSQKTPGKNNSCWLLDPPPTKQTKLPNRWLRSIEL